MTTTRENDHLVGVECRGRKKLHITSGHCATTFCGLTVTAGMVNIMPVSRDRVFPLGPDDAQRDDLCGNCKYGAYRRGHMDYAPYA